MLAYGLFIATLASLALADPDPKTPATTDVGQPLSIVYGIDTSGAWKSTTVSLMSGSNLAMQKVVDIATNHDCTTSPGQFSWVVPNVSPNAAIYFLQFTNNNNASAEPIWTTRFAIASASGQTTAPANSVEPNGQAIPWGVGALVGGAAGSSAAAAAGTVQGGSTNTAVVAAAAPSGASQATVTQAAATTQSSVFITSTTSSGSSSSSSSSSSSTSASSSSKAVSMTSGQNSAAGLALSVGSLKMGAGAAVIACALTLAA